MGSVEMGLYATGNQLLEAGVVSGRDMTVECAVTKLMVLFGQGYSSKEVRELMCKSLAGEMKEN
jgi:L-asparaginase